MALSYNLAYQEIILVHPTRRQNLLANNTLLSGTSENESYSFCFDPATKPYVPQRLIRKADQWARDKWQRRPPPCTTCNVAQASKPSKGLECSIGANNHLLHDQ